MKDIAFICNEPTPYRLHLLKRLADEHPQLRVHSIFTHTFDTAHVPWQMDLSTIPRTVFFEHEAMAHKNTLLQAWKLNSQITRYIQTRNIRMVVLNGYGDVSRLLLMRWAKKRGIKVLLRGDSNIHGQEKITGLRRLIKGMTLRWISHQIAGLMPMGRCGQAFFDHWMGDHKLPSFICPYEPNYDQIRSCGPRCCSQFMQDKKLDQTHRHLLYCGRLIDIKNVDLIITAFERISRQRPDWDLLIAGTGPLEANLKAMVTSELKNRVKFLGFLQFDQTVACYCASHVLVHPPSYEPWALVINEAVAAGLPIIATDVVGAANELIEPGVNGLLIKPNDVDALTDAMFTMTQGDTASRMGGQAAAVLERWQQKADPVMAIVNAAARFA
jgi:glycosyltransferase involved in cell wall biosynthesis